jgi:phage tail sheath gpL-like
VAFYEQSGNTGYRYVGRLNFSLFPTGNAQFNDQATWFLTASRNGPNAGPSTAQVTSALNNGLTPYAILSDGTLQMVKRVTTRSLNGATADYRARDPHKVAIVDAWATAAATVVSQQFAAKDLLDAPATGQNPQGGVPPNVFATNATLIGNALKDLTEKMGIAGLLQNTDATNANAIVQRESSPRNRVSASFDLQTADILDQTAILAQQVA